MSELEKTVAYLGRVCQENRRAVFWTIASLLLLWMLVSVKELTTLVLLSYGLSLLLDPIVARMETKRISRGLSIALIGFLLIVFCLFFLIIAVPPIISEYQDLVVRLPEYVAHAGEKVVSIARSWFKININLNQQDIATRVREHLASLEIEQVKGFSLAVLRTMLSGYSFALTVLNLFLLPFFIFYITRDLSIIHRFLGGALSVDVREKATRLGSEILEHVYAFFKGQLMVAALLAGFYSLGFTIVGLNSAFVVGVLSGLLSAVPYLGAFTALVLSTLITLFSDPHISQFVQVYVVIAVVQLIEGTVLTPRIVGESVGIHPFGVMLTLIVGGQLFGLAGLVLAIPVAASLRVVFRQLRNKYAN